MDRAHVVADPGRKHRDDRLRAGGRAGVSRPSGAVRKPLSPFAVILVVPMCLASKNANLIVEFAKEKSAQGASPRDATLEACRLRLRPIIMTSLAFILGVVPLALSAEEPAARIIRVTVRQPAKTQPVSTVVKLANVGAVIVAESPCSKLTNAGTSSMASLLARDEWM